MNNSTKRCSKCGDWKVLADFPRDRTRPDGFGCYCKPCRNARSMQWRAQQTPDDPEAERYPEYVPFRRVDDVLPRVPGLQQFLGGDR
jgi:hypothetical protein